MGYVGLFERLGGELAAGEERAHLARELHDSVTQALFSMTMVTRSIELLLDRDPAGARAAMRRHFNRLIEALLDAAEQRALHEARRKASESRERFSITARIG